MSTDSEEVHSRRTSGAVILALIVLAGILFGAWPSYRQTAMSGAAALMRPLAQRLHFQETALARFNTGPASRETLSTQSALACAARSMEFRFERLSIDPDLLREWTAEWKLTPAQKPVLLSMLLRELPEPAAIRNSALQKKMAETVLTMAIEGDHADPENGFYWLSEGLVLFHIGQSAPAIAALQQAQNCPRMDAGLKELNRSENALWHLDRKTWTLFAMPPRTWGLELQRPLQVLSHSLAQEERAALKKYNMERAIELTLMHLNLAARVAEIAWTPLDVATGHAMVVHALEPFWIVKAREPSLPQLQQNFLDLLEDQGDKLSASKSRGYWEAVAKREKACAAMQPTWRIIQQIASWKASVVLGCLMLQTISLLLTWVTIVMAAGVTSPKDIYVGSVFSPIEPVGAFPTLAFMVAPFLWGVSNWPAGGAYFMAGLAGSWLLWFLLLRLSSFPTTLAGWKEAVANVLVMNLMATVSTAVLLAAILEYRTRHLEIVLQRGWSL
jgi:hypothetical protein